MNNYVLFVMSPFISHLMPTYKVAKDIQKKGYKVVYISTIKYKREIESNGFLFQHSLIKSDENVPLRTEDIIPFLISKYSPTMFFLEIAFWNWALILKGQKKSFVMIQTMPCCDKAPYILPTGYRIEAKRNVINFFKNEIAWLRHNNKNSNLLKTGAMSEHYKKIVKISNLDSNKEHLSKKNRIEYFRVLGIPELILYPAELDVSRQQNPHTLFIGPFIDINRKEKEINWSNININQRNIVYCSLGSLSKLCKDSKLFYTRVIDTFRQLNNLILIMSVGDYFSDFPVDDLPENIHIFKYVPQLEILRKSKVFITHGGASSIKESILFGVPMLVYPWKEKSDMYGNADRIVYHKLGITGNMEKDESSDIKKKIIELINNDEIKKGIIQMKYIFENYQAKENSIIDLLLQYPTNPSITKQIQFESIR
jgi:zeaxanthin glucosyltransferase